MMPCQVQPARVNHHVSTESCLSSEKPIPRGRRVQYRWKSAASQPNPDSRKHPAAGYYCQHRTPAEQYSSVLQAVQAYSETLSSSHPQALWHSAPSVAVFGLVGQESSEAAAHLDHAASVLASTMDCPEGREKTRTRTAHHHRLNLERARQNNAAQRSWSLHRNRRV